MGANTAVKAVIEPVLSFTLQQKHYLHYWFANESILYYNGERKACPALLKYSKSLESLKMAHTTLFIHFAFIKQRDL